MAEKMRARVIRVRVDRQSGTLAVAAEVGDEMLQLKDAGDFAAPGTLQVDDDAGTLLDFTAVTLVEDDDPTDLDSPDTITLAEPLAVAIDVGTSLWVYEADDDDDPRVAEVIASCIPEDDEGAPETGEPIQAVVPRDYQDDLPPGERPAPGVPVVLEWVEFDVGTGQWEVARIRGKGSRAIQFEHAEPAYTPTDGELTAGTFTRQLLHRNIASEHGLFTTINGVALGSDLWTLDAVAGLVTVTIPDWVADAPADRREFGWPMYAYRRGIAVDPPEVDPVAPTWTIPQIITAYEHHGVYIDDGPYIGMTIAEAAAAGLRVYEFDTIHFDWRIPDEWTLPDWAFDTLGVVSMRIDAEFDGAGSVGFYWDISNPGYPSAAEWPDGTDSGSHITLDSYWGDGVEGCIPAPSTWSREFATEATASDPYYEGENYDDVLHKLEVSLRSRTDGINWVSGQLAVMAGSGEITPTGFDLIVIGTA